MAIDAHIHLWRRADGDGIWLPEKIGGLARDFTFADWRSQADASGIDGVVLVQAAHETRESLRWLAEAERLPRLLGVVAWADLHSPDLRAEIARYRKFGKFAGIRPLPPGTFGGDWLADPRTRTGLATLGDENVVTDILVKWPSLPAVTSLLADFPDLPVVLNHCGRPDTMTGKLEPWASDLRALARSTKATVKCSGLIERAGIEWSKTALRPYVETVIDAFGPARVMFATNWPVIEIGGTYAGWVRTFAEICDDLGVSPADRTQMLEGTARRAYRLGPV
ncbi:MAG: amidohydrolase family protein [Rhodospirillales bacterium]|nr:amidohydrolase family protein [Rhodospirillales bacterium]